jgi:hypothetical protein
MSSSEKIMTKSSQYRPPRVDEEFVLRKCDYFAKVGLWGRRSGIRPRPWLNNFDGEEREYAVSLLNGFLYFSDDMMLELLRGAFHGLSRTYFAGRAERSSVWMDFADRAIFTPVRADNDDPAESGLEWSSRWKKDLQLDELRVRWPEDALKLVRNDPATPIVFIDDFVGSGSQMRRMWSREIHLVGEGMATYSFRELGEQGGAPLIYTPALCTTLGRKNLTEHCPGLYVNPGNSITRQHSALEEDSLVWPAEHLDGGVDFLREASRRAGIPDDRWRGFEELGLVLAFGQSVPDSTLPLLYWEEDGWQPLIRRT